MRLTQRLEELLSDVRLAVRQLISARGFTLVAALTLALGIGVNSAIFSLADAALMRPLPFGEAERLVMLWERTPTSPKTGVSPLNMRDWNLQSRSFEGIAFVQRGMGGGPLLTAPDGSIETAERQSTSANFFDVLKVVPIVGRTFKPEDDGPSPRVVLLGEAVWRRRFSSDPSIVGRLVRLNGQPYTVVGVVADNVQFSRPAEIWTLSRPVPGHPDVARRPRLRGRRAPEAWRDDRGGAGRAERHCRPARARISRSEQGNRRDRRADPRRHRRERFGDDVDVPAGRGGLRAAPVLRERRQSAARAGCRRAPVKSPCGPRSAPRADASSGSCSPRASCSRCSAGCWASASAPRFSGPRQR